LKNVFGCHGDKNALFVVFAVRSEFTRGSVTFVPQTRWSGRKLEFTTGRSCSPRRIIAIGRWGRVGVSSRGGGSNVPLHIICLSLSFVFNKVGIK
jgi:hypothetical protein